MFEVLVGARSMEVVAALETNPLFRSIPIQANGAVLGLARGWDDEGVREGRWRCMEAPEVNTVCGTQMGEEKTDLAEQYDEEQRRRDANQDRGCGEREEGDGKDYNREPEHAHTTGGGCDPWCGRCVQAR